MKSMTNLRKAIRFALLGILVAVSISTSLSLPTTRAKGAPALLSITVTNNSNRSIAHLYLQAVDPGPWGPDLMSQNTVINSGQSFTITDATCSGNEIKVIAEDPQGCFLYGVVSCSQGTTTWTITNDTVADCGH